MDIAHNYQNTRFKLRASGLEVLHKYFMFINVRFLGMNRFERKMLICVPQLRGG